MQSRCTRRGIGRPSKPLQLQFASSVVGRGGFVSMGAGMDRRCPRMQARFDKRAGGRILSSGTPEPSPRSLTAVVTEARPSREMSQPFHSALTFPRRWKMSTPWPYIHARPRLPLSCVRVVCPRMLRWTSSHPFLGLRAPGSLYHPQAFI
jgi:hypothetical protein